MIELRPLNKLSIHLDRLIQGRLWLKVIIGLILGAGLGILLNPSTGLISEGTSLRLADWLDLPGQIFMRLVQMIMIPLIFTSIITGIVSNTSENLKSFGIWLLLYFFFTTAVAIIIGLAVTLILKPGQYIFDLGGFPNSGGNQTAPNDQTNLLENIPNAISNLIPTNPLESILTGEMLAVVIFTIIIGVAITQLQQETAKPIIRFSEAIQKICMIVVSWAMMLVPYAVFGLIAALLSRTSIEIFVGLGYYMSVVILGLIILVIFYLALVLIITKKKPFKFLKTIREPQLLAFSTASSAAVMPLSMKTADEKLGVSSNISDFVIPIGATINMDGTALFQCVTTLFMAQAYGIELTIMNLLLITFTVVAASIGTPAIPGGGVIILASVLQSAGIPIDGLIIIIGIDRILGMFRTAVNVTGDLTACLIFNKFHGATQNEASITDKT
ncbi:dicarboxylate/amino acid:cation symporter [Maribacter sp. PR1]|uniref:Dicarboxylate/amino acid:cation symporter n=1 Tax=Maribacter cobaltidurans TaxID=1178778 RepID=A0ABU7IZC5_9FLAO|nr:MULTISPECIES: dicarboxylate/amino acid:cation symporter [Maribacter]MDC6390942.1 dicarboxylate/amino acid:cation symporter [Maribacter sp. PR1]MEE1978334.1 dicarboxylate/amino acid:cation symporter [Maribacter cobaltidurans]